MARRKKVYDDDDGRTIADMSGVHRPNFLGMHPPARPERKNDIQSQAEGKPERPWEAEETFTRAERRWYALGALKAALLIGLVFIVGLGAAIAAMILLWS